jgi:hypothetical protein
VALALRTYDFQDATLALGIFVFVTTLSAGSLPFFRLTWDEASELQNKSSELFGSGYPGRQAGVYDAIRQADGRFVVTDKIGRGPTICYECLSLVTPTDGKCWRCGYYLPGGIRDDADTEVSR